MNNWSDPNIKLQTVCRIKSKKSGRYLTVSRDSETAGVLIISNSYNKKESLFQLIKHDSHLKIQSQLNSQYLSVLRTSSETGSAIVALPDF